MLYIEKQPCPPHIQDKIDRITSEKEFRKLPEVNAGKSTNKTLRKYFNRLDKEQVRDALLQEQGYLCAYCMAEIKNDGNTTTIEHFLPLSMYKSRALDYSNYMAVCNGGRKAVSGNGRKKVQCCDASKSNTITELTPHKKEMVDRLYYDNHGRIRTKHESEEIKNRIQKEIDNVFVLNGKLIDGKHYDTSTGIVKKRKDRYINMEMMLNSEKSSKTLTVEKIDRMIEKLEHPDTNHKKQFSGVDLFLLRKYRKMAE